MKRPLPLLLGYVVFSAAVLWFGIQNISGIQSASQMDFRNWRKGIEDRLENRITRLQTMLVDPQAVEDTPVDSEPMSIALLLYKESTPYQYRYTLPPVRPLPKLQEGEERAKSIQVLHKEVTARLRTIQRCKRLVRLIEEVPLFETPTAGKKDYTLVISDHEYRFERSFSQAMLKEQPPALLLATLLSQYTDAEPLHPTLAQNDADQIH